MKVNSNAINYEYLLLEYYKKLGMNETETLVLLMIEHLTKDEPSLITASNLALKMALDVNELDVVMNNLYVKGLIDVKPINGRVVTSLEPTYKKIFECLKEAIIRTEEVLDNKELEKARNDIATLLEETLGRPLSGLEEDSVTNWIASGIDKKVIINCIKDAKKLRYVDINVIDRMILNKMREQDNYGNELK